MISKGEKTLQTQEHYTAQDGGVEPIDLIISMGLNFLEGNVVKYVCRHRKKNGLQDLEKAQVYLDWLIQVEEARKTTAIEKENT
jgi:hypothetical protein